MEERQRPSDAEGVSAHPVHRHPLKLGGLSQQRLDLGRQDWLALRPPEEGGPLQTVSEGQKKVIYPKLSIDLTRTYSTGRRFSFAS